MWRSKATISLLHEEYVLKSEEAEIIRAEIEKILQAFNKADFSEIDRFEELLVQVFNIIKENIQQYNKEETRLELEEVITKFFHKHLFSVVNDEIIEHVRQGFRERLERALKEIEHTRPHGKRPASTYFRKLLKENKTLDKKMLADARKLLNLHKDEKETREQLYNLLMVLIRERGLRGSSLVRYEERLDKAIDHFIKIVAQEFKALYDAEVDVTLEEADLVHEINIVLEKKIPREHRKKLKELKKKIRDFVKKDIRQIKKQARA